MLHVQNESLSVTMDAFFHSAVSFDKAGLNTVANNALEKFSNYNLRFNQIVQRSGDQLFNYDLSFPLFANQGQVRLHPDRLFVNLENVRGEGDLEIVVQTLVRAVQCLPSDLVTRLSFRAAAHAAFQSETESKDFFAPFVDKGKSIIDGGRIVVVKEDAWPSPVRLLLERSLVSINGLYLGWMLEQPGTVNLETLKEIADKFGVAAKSAGLELIFQKPQ